MGYIILSFLIGVVLGTSLEWGLIQAWLKYKKQNKVHFYLTRDKNYCLKLWFDKPKRDGDEWISDYSTYSSIIAYGGEIEGLGLNQDDYDNLTWNDEPLEVFITLEE